MGRLFSWGSNSSNNNNRSAGAVGERASSRVVKRTATSAGGGGNNQTTTSKTHPQHQQPPLPSSPVRPRSFSTDNTTADAPDLSPRRRRYNSRDYPRSYSGQYGQVDDLLPLELNRHRSPTQSATMMIGLYITLVLLVHLLVAFVLLVPAAERGLVVSPLSWTWTHAIHCAFTLLYLHWLKGSLYDDSGEMNALTLWEQWEASGVISRPVREAAMVVPCVLCWAACHASDYEPRISALNGIIWAATLLPKMPFMNGVRLFGINSTAGIDDEGSQKSKTP